MPRLRFLKYTILLFVVWSLSACSESDTVLPTVLADIELISATQLAPFNKTAVPENVIPMPEEIGLTPTVDITQAGEAAPEQGETEVICNIAGPGRPLDVSIPDGTVVSQGQFFTKTWRLINLGSCIWTDRYSLVWFSGSEMGTTQSVNLDTEVYPGSFIDISVDLTAPEVSGIHQSNWKLKNEDGVLFGIGPNGDYPIWVRVLVVDAVTSTPESGVEPSEIPVILALSERKIIMGESLDLDSEEISDNLDADLQFGTVQDSMPALLAINGAGFSIHGLVEPSIEQCQSLPNDSVSIPLAEIGDQFVCYKTNLGLTGYFQTSQIELSDSSIRINFLSWQIQ